MFRRLAGTLRHAAGPTARRSLLSLADQGFVSGTSFFATIVVGRFGGEGALGVYALGLTVVVFISTAQDSLISVPYTFFRQRSVDTEATAYAGGSLIHHWILVSLAVLGLGAAGAVLAFAADSTRALAFVGVLTCVVPFALLKSFARRFAFAHHRVQAALIVDIGVSAVQIGALIWLGFAGRLTALTALLALGVANGLVGVMWLVVSRRQFSFERRAVGVAFDRHWRFARWDFAAEMLGVAQGYGLHWLLAFVEGAEALGVFAACLTLVGVSNPIVMGVNNVLMPRVADASQESGDAEVWRVVRKSALVLAGLLSVPCALLVIFGGDLVRLLYGPGFEGQGTTVAILALVILVWGWQIAATNGLRAFDRADSYTAATLAGLAVTLGSGPPLIAQLGLPGAALALFLGGVIETSIEWVVLRRCLKESGARSLPTASD